jgi:hypothetical protein
MWLSLARALASEARDRRFESFHSDIPETIWQTSSLGQHGGVFINIVEWAREGTHPQEVQKFLDEQQTACRNQEQNNPVLRERRKKIDKQRRREARQKKRDVAQSG